MLAPNEILSAWRKFDLFPMETLTKAWSFRRRSGAWQRDVAEMIAHRETTGASGNCFDLAFWLWHEFEQAGVEAYAIGDFLGTTDAHVGLVALDGNGRRFLCDLGDLWIQPILIDDPRDGLHEGFFTGARVKVLNQGSKLSVEYHRSNGKMSRQSYDLTPVSKAALQEAGEVSQRHLSRPLVEMRLQENGETIHWEFDDGQSFFSRMGGLEEEPPCASSDEWARRISEATGMNAAYVAQCLLDFKS